MGKVHKIKRRITKIIKARDTGRHYFYGMSIWYSKRNDGSYYMLASRGYYKLIDWIENKYLGG